MLEPLSYIMFYAGPALATAYYTDPDNAIGFVAQCELNRHVKSG